MGRKARQKRERLGRERRELTSLLATQGHAESLRMVRERLPGIAFAPAPRGATKISDALVELVKPLVAELGPHNLTKERYQSLLSIAALVWNEAHSPLATVLSDVLRLAGPEADVPLFTHFVDVLTLRRRLLFPADRRLVASVAVSDGHEPGRFSVSAVYATPRAAV